MYRKKIKRKKRKCAEKLSLQCYRAGGKHPLDVGLGAPSGNLRTLIILSLREADEKKINELGMKLVRQLLCQSFPEAVCVQTGSTELTVICTVEGEAAEEQLLKFDNAVNNLLDVTFGKRRCAFPGNIPFGSPTRRSGRKRKRSGRRIP